MRVFAFCGSLRKGSYNRMALRAAEELSPEGVLFETFDIGRLPLYNEDVRAEGFPPPVEEMRKQIAQRLEDFLARALRVVVEAVERQHPVVQVDEIHLVGIDIRVGVGERDGDVARIQPLHDWIPAFAGMSFALIFSLRTLG